MSDVLFCKSFECECGKTHELNTEIVFEKNAVERTSDYIQRVFLQGNIAVCTSESVSDIAKTAQTQLYKNGYTIREVLIGDSKSVEEGCAEILKIPECVRYLLGVGSGAIADMVRLAASKMDIGYAIIATAPSTDGYLADKVKNFASGEYVECKPPELLIVDESIIEKAPSRLTAAGYGRVVAQIVNIFDSEFNKFAHMKSYCEVVLNALAKEIHQFELDKDKPDFKKRLMKILISISRANVYLDFRDTATDCFAAVLSRIQPQRTEGENSLPAAYIVLNLYKSYLNSPAVDTMLPPDILKTVKLLEKSNVINYNKYIKNIQPTTVSNYLQQAFVLGEYRRDLFDLISEIDLSGITRFWRRLYSDAGFWLKNYMTNMQLMRYLSLAAELSNNTLLKHMKRVGFLENCI